MINLMLSVTNTRIVNQVIQFSYTIFVYIYMFV